MASETGSGSAVVLVSGGMDSCVTAAIAANEVGSGGRLFFLHFSYGQRTEAKERECFLAIAAHFGVGDTLVARLDHIRAIGGSSLTDPSSAVPPADLARREIPPTYVPFRNAQFLATAAAWAETVGASRIYIGAVEEDSSGYPDCRRGFFDAFEKAIDAGTRPQTRLKIMTPVIGMTKGAIVRRGLELGAPLGQTWSCYQSEQVACGRCDSCALRLRGFAQAGARDPIEYACT